MRAQNQRPKHTVLTGLSCQEKRRLNFGEIREVSRNHRLPTVKEKPYIYAECYTKQNHL